MSPEWRSVSAAAGTGWRPGPSSRRRSKKPARASWMPSGPRWTAPLEPPPVSRLPESPAMSDTSPRFVLSTLTLPARMVLAVFLMSVGVGYFSALVQLHFQHATPGELLPTPENAVAAYSGQVNGK